MNRFGVGEVTPLWNAGFVANPFRALSDAEWQELALVPAPVRAVLDRQDSSHLQILGAAGHGKSSTLRAVMREANDVQKVAVFEYIPNGAETFSTNPPDGCWFCLDEAQRLRSGERERLIRICGSLSVRLFLGTHEDLSPLFKRAGLPLATVSLQTMDEAHFDAVLQIRVSHFARSGMPHCTLTADALASLRSRFGGDLRTAERFLYDFFQVAVRNADPITAQALNQESRSSR